MLRRFYDRIVLEYPKAVFLSTLIFIVFLGYHATKLEIDASTDTLILENDVDLRYTRAVNARYKTPPILIITYTPTDYLLSDRTLNNIRNLEKDLESLELVDSVTTILNVPLLESPPKPVKEMLKNIPTLETPGIDKDLARAEFLHSPIYPNMLVSVDFKTTGLQVELKEDMVYDNLVNRRYALRQLEKDGKITTEERRELKKIQIDFKMHRDMMRVKRHNTILEIRAVMDKYRGEADLFLGGVSMISDDIITYLKNDLRTFGLGVLVFLIITLWIIFRQLRWILIPLLTCAFSVTATTGFLGMFGWEVTVISSNFISLQLIITMAITIHLIVRYRELVLKNPGEGQRELVLDAVLLMAKPCLFMALTTIAGFCSLLLSDMLPVNNFGWMMAVGIGVSLILTFLIFPTVLVQMEKVAPNTSFERHFRLTEKLADITKNYRNPILLISGVVLVFSGAGISKLEVENSFINYFKETTEIYQGMKIIDRQLGGTTPLDITLDFGETEVAPQPKQADSKTQSEEDDEFDEFEEEFEKDKHSEQYWFTSDKMEKVEKIHDYLDNIPETGKVLSLGTMLKIGRTLNDGKPLDNFQLALIYKELPERFRKIIIDPYVSIEDNQVRFAVRVRDSNPNLKRNELLKKIRRDLNNDLEMEKGKKVRLTGLMVLYNNMLQSLFDSQILTLGAVVAALLIMFLILFRSLKIALIAIVPNLLSVSVVLGFMGWVGIPLDMMTITIASISVGIAVDNTIHYIHRFKIEFVKDRDYTATMYRCHGSIGYAMYYTSVTIIIGFSILVISNFIPTIYFGMLTSLAMAMALIAALTLLPQLIIFLKPLENEKAAQ
jgi:hypothetical protein